MKVLVNINEPSSDHVKLKHQTFGTLWILCSYEKARICRFCCYLGHEMPFCLKQAKVTAIVSNPNYEGSYQPLDVLAPKLAQWVTKAEHPFGRPNGLFSVKKTYNAFSGISLYTSQGQAAIWKVIWKKGYVLPRLRVFLWKVVNNALPLGKILGSRGIRLDQGYSM